MNDEGKVVSRGEKNAGIIMSLCELYGMTLEEATDLFYMSETSTMIEDGVAELQCRSERYLASLVMEEFKEQPFLCDPPAKYGKDH